MIDLVVENEESSPDRNLALSAGIPCQAESGTEVILVRLVKAIDFLVTEKHLTRDDAYMLASVAVDFCTTELVDGNKGVHGMIPKAIFLDRKREAGR